MQDTRTTGQSRMDKLITMATVILVLLFGVSAFYHWWWIPRHAPAGGHQVHPVVEIEARDGPAAAYEAAKALAFSGEASDEDLYHFTTLGTRLGHLDEVRPVLENWTAGPDVCTAALVAAFRFGIMAGEREKAMTFGRRLLDREPGALRDPALWPLYEELSARQLAGGDELFEVTAEDAALSPVFALAYLRRGGAPADVRSLIEGRENPMQAGLVKAVLDLQENREDEARSAFGLAMAGALSDNNPVILNRVLVTSRFLDRGNWPFEILDQAFSSVGEAPALSPLSLQLYLQLLRERGATAKMLEVVKASGSQQEKATHGAFLPVYLELLLGHNVEETASALLLGSPASGSDWERKTAAALAALRIEKPEQALEILAGMEADTDRPLGDLPRVLYAAALGRVGRAEEARAQLQGIQLGALLPEERELVAGLLP